MTVIVLPQTGLIGRMTVSKNGDQAPLLFTDVNQMEIARANLVNNGYEIENFDPSLIIHASATSALRHAKVFCRDR